MRCPSIIAAGRGPTILSQQRSTNIDCGFFRFATPGPVDLVAQ
jgi:hypothetical protein